MAGSCPADRISNESEMLPWLMNQADFSESDSGVADTDLELESDYRIVLCRGCHFYAADGNFHCKIAITVPFVLCRGCHVLCCGLQLSL